MSIPAGDAFDRAALERFMADSGIKVAQAEIDALAGSLVRIRKAAAIILRSIPFDATIEQFFRLLESDANREAGA